MRLIDADKLPFEEVWTWEHGTFQPTTGEIVDGKAIREAPTVEAIPVEWIVNKWAKKFWKVINGKKYYTGDGYDTVWDMIEDWEKENGTI